MKPQPQKGGSLAIREPPNETRWVLVGNAREKEVDWSRCDRIAQMNSELRTRGALVSQQGRQNILHRRVDRWKKKVGVEASGIQINGSIATRHQFEFRR